jgi:hypothetical protein
MRIGIFVISLVLAVIVSVTSVILRQLFDPTVRGARDIEEILEITPLTAVPVIKPAKHVRHRAVGPKLAVTSAAIAALTLAGYFVRYFIG